MFFSFMQDKDSLWQAAFTSKDPTDLTAHTEHWNKNLSNPEVQMKTILVDDHVVGNIGRYFMEGVAEVTYWVGTEFQNKGIATLALAKFLLIDRTRPMLARIAFDNEASAMVLLKNGFTVIATDKYFSNARGQKIKEIIWRLV